MGMTLKELLTKGEGTLSAQEAKALAAQCRMDLDTLYTLLEDAGSRSGRRDRAQLDVEGIMAEVENAENNNDDLGIGADEDEDQGEENPADLKAAMDELLDDPVKNYLKQIGQIPLLSAEQEVELSRRIHAGAELPTSCRPTARSTARPSTSRRTAPASRLKRTRTAAATPRIWTTTATRSPARTPRRRLPRKRLWRPWKTVL